MAAHAVAREMQRSFRSVDNDLIYAECDGAEAQSIAYRSGDLPHGRIE